MTAGGRGVIKFGEPNYQTLPPLDQIAPRQRFETRFSNADVITLLRSTAQKLRNGSAVRFYSVRAISAHFGLPQSAVDEIYGTLRTEGVLNSKWGSGTFVTPLSVNRRLEVRGVIAELVPLAALKDEPMCRHLVNDVSTALWHRHFASRLWVYDETDAAEPGYCDKILAEKPDSIVWLMPGSRASQLGYRLMNCGIRVVRGSSVAEVLGKLFASRGAS